MRVRKGVFVREIVCEKECELVFEEGCSVAV